MLGFSGNCASGLGIESLTMHTEGCPSLKLNTEFDGSSALNNSSVLEDDLALSSSTLGPTDKSLQEHESSRCDYKCADALVYVNEDTMDCSYSAGPQSQGGSRTEVSSPEMFESDDDDDCRRTAANDFGEDAQGRREKNFDTRSDVEKEELSERELVIKSDCYLLARMNKFLAGVPPPPKHTICQSDCADFLLCIRENREYFVIDPLSGNDEDSSKIATPTAKVDDAKSSTNGRCFDHRAKSSLRNLTNAFDACSRSSEAATDVGDKSTSDNADDAEKTGENSGDREASTGRDASSSDDVARRATSSGENCASKDNCKHVTFKMPRDEPTPFYSTIGVEEAKKLEWDVAYHHKTHGIHYNRSKTMEEFESLTMKLCQRYIGAETQSSCNIWFTKQAPASVKKRNLLSRRNNGQSPGKRLSHLARRRRTFSSANLQVLGMADKKQLVLNIKKPTIRKGKSPRGKSPRGSAKKRASLRPSPSPRKSKLETSKRALFQSPPNDRAGPSSRVVTLINSNPQQRIKRALFPTAKTKEDVATVSSLNEAKKAIPFEESRKRKNEEDLEGPRFKWAKSLSFDCAHGLESNSSDSWSSERHSTGSFLMKSETHLQQGKCELSETHRKKLLWAVAEALRSRGIGMGHPRFKQCASQLAKTVKKYMPDLENRNVPRKPGSTSDRMLKLAKHHVLLIVESRPAE